MNFLRGRRGRKRIITKCVFMWNNPLKANAVQDKCVTNEMREYKQDFHKHYRVHPLSREIIIFISTSAIFSTFALWIIPCYYLYYNRKRATDSKTSLFTAVCNGMFVFRRVGWSEVGNNVNIKRIWRCLRTRLNTSPVVNYSKRQRTYSTYHVSEKYTPAKINRPPGSWCTIWRYIFIICF